MNDIQKAEFKILGYFHKFCENHNLKYSLYGGTLLGSIRHKGFIPWDDDTDVMMKRDEFERFEKLFLKSDYEREGYSYQTRKLIPSYALAFSKIRTREINIRERVSKTQKGNYGPWLDIFPLDNVPDDEDLRRAQFKKVAFYNKLIRLFLLVYLKEEDKGLRKILKGLVQWSNENLGRLYFFMPYIFRKRNHYMTMYNQVSTSHCADISYIFYKDYEDFSKQIFENQMMDDLILGEFESGDFFIPRKYDEILTIMYGDYMELPPVEERKQHNLEYIYQD